MLIQVSLMLPYLLRLRMESISPALKGVQFRCGGQYIPEQNTKRTVVSAQFDAPTSPELKPQLIPAKPASGSPAQTHKSPDSLVSCGNTASGRRGSDKGTGKSFHIHGKEHQHFLGQ